MPRAMIADRVVAAFLVVGVARDYRYSQSVEQEIVRRLGAVYGPYTGTCFAKDLRNLTLASPRLNRNIKSAKDAGEWLPDRNRCWFAARVVEVRRAYGLTIDRCASTEMEPVVCRAPTAGSREQGTGPVPDGAGGVLARYDDNGRITCKEARRHGIAPVASDHPAYRFMHDGDGDGVVCE